MTCASCINHVEKSLIKYKGIYHVLVGLLIEKDEKKFYSALIRTNLKFNL